MPYCQLSAINIPESHPVALFGRYWNSRKQETGALPLRSDFGPSSIPDLVPWLLLLEPLRLDGRTEFRYRLAGTGCREIFGVDYTGKLLGEALTTDGAEIRRNEFLQVMASGEPIYSWTEVPIQGRDFIHIYRGVFPVTTAGGEADRIFVVAAHEAQRRKESPLMAALPLRA